MVLGEYDVAVIGGGHAGCEAALAAARLGMKTVMFSISLDAIGNLPCNPSIGGTAKGHLVRELDALGGEMGKAADASFIQSKMLNKGKGPAVHSLRAQIDRKKYHVEMKKRVENQENLQVKQAEIVNVITDEDNNVTEVVTHTGVEYKVKAVIIASGTYLKGKVLIGSYSRESGPDGMFPANELSENLRRLGIELKRVLQQECTRIHLTTVRWSLRRVTKKSCRSRLKRRMSAKILFLAILYIQMKKLTKLYTTISVVRQCMAVWLRV